MSTDPEILKLELYFLKFGLLLFVKILAVKLRLMDPAKVGLVPLIEFGPPFALSHSLRGTLTEGVNCERPYL